MVIYLKIIMIGVLEWQCLAVLPSKKVKKEDQTWISWPKQRGSHGGVTADSFPFCSSAHTEDGSANMLLPLMNTEAYKCLPQTNNFCPLSLPLWSERGMKSAACVRGLFRPLTIFIFYVNPKHLDQSLRRKCEFVDRGHVSYSHFSNSGSRNNFETN